MCLSTLFPLCCTFFSWISCKHFSHPTSKVLDLPQLWQMFSTAASISSVIFIVDNHSLKPRKRYLWSTRLISSTRLPWIIWHSSTHTHVCKLMQRWNVSYSNHHINRVCRALILFSSQFPAALYISLYLFLHLQRDRQEEEEQRATESSSSPAHSTYTFSCSLVPSLLLFHHCFFSNWSAVGLGEMTGKLAWGAGVRWLTAPTCERGN